MALSLVFNPFTGKFDYVNASTIAEVTSDPASPVAGQTWVLHTTVTGVTGTPLGLLLAITYSSSTTNLYELSYYTLENTIVRTVLN